MRIFLITLVFVLLVGFLLQAPFSELQKNAAAVRETGKGKEQVALTIAMQGKKAEDIFSSVSVEAHAVIVKEFPSGKILFEKNANDRVPLASLAKLMTAFALQDLQSSHVSSGPSVVSISENAVAEDGDSGLLVDERFYFDDLLNIMLVQSSNDAAFALSAFAGGLLGGGGEENARAESFVHYMNVKKEEIGLKGMYFFNMTGLDVNEEENISGAYGTAGDIASLVGFLLERYPFTLEKTQLDVLDVVSLNKEHTFKNSNALASIIPGLRASKTGYTKLAGGNLVVAVDIGVGHTVIIGVLGSTFDGRFSDVKKLYAAAVSYYEE